jgi:hypothetical protein
LWCAHDLEDRVVAGLAPGRQRLDEAFERQVLVSERCQRAGADLAQQVGAGGARSNVGAHDQRVREEADQGLQLDAAAVGDRRADEDRGLPGIATEKPLEGCEERHEESDAVATDEPAEGVGQPRVQFEGKAASPESLDRRARPVEGEIEELGRVGELVAPVRELALERAIGQPLALPDGEVGVLKQGLGKLQALAAAE